MAKPRKRKKTGKKAPKKRKPLSARKKKLVARKISAVKLRNNALKKLDELSEDKNLTMEEKRKERNRLIDEVQDLNTLKSKLNQKLEKAGAKPKTKGRKYREDTYNEERHEENVFRAWDMKELKETIAGAKKVNGKSNEKDADAILDELNDNAGDMGSDDYFVVREDMETGNITIYLVRGSDNLPEHLQPEI